MLGEPGGVDVDGDFAEVDGGQGRGVGQDVLVGAGGQGDCGGGVEDVLLQEAGGEEAVHAEEGVAQRGVLGQDELVGQLAGVAGGDQLQSAAGVVLEGADEVVGHGESVVGDDGDGLAVAAGGVAARVLGAAGRERQADGGGRARGHHGAARQRAGSAGGSGETGGAGGGHGSSWADSGRARARRPRPEPRPGRFDSTSFAGAGRIRFEGLRSPALSAPWSSEWDRAPAPPTSGAPLSWWVEFRRSAPGRREADSARERGRRPRIDSTTGTTGAQVCPVPFRR